MTVIYRILGCPKMGSLQEQQEEEITIQKVDFLERNVEQTNKRIDSIKNEAEQIVNEIN